VKSEPTPITRVLEFTRGISVNSPLGLLSTYATT
jgi:hypothetical protein